MKRRGFVKLCAAAVAGITASPELIASSDQEYRRYDRVSLVDPYSKKPVKVSSLQIGETYLFHYPFVSTPCFLIDLGRPVKSVTRLRTDDGKSYRWRGGVGPNRSFVAFSAICTHRMSHPAKSVSFINYRHQEVQFRNSHDQIEQRAGVIYCCSENSVYDPAEGGRVIGGPAPQPLAAIALEYDAQADSFYSTGTIGGEMFAKYFERFSDRLVLEHGRTDIDAATLGTTELVRLSDFTSNTISCQA